MQAVNLLTLVILVGFLLKVEKSPYSRIIIGSVFGIMFFSIWPFTVYYVDIYKLSKTHLISSYVVISILAVIFSILLIRIKQKFAVGVVALLLFSSITIITLSFESKIKTNASATNISSYDYENLYLNKGDDFGCFEMGSTIVILAEKGTFELNVQAGQNVKYGQNIAKIK